MKLLILAKSSPFECVGYRAAYRNSHDITSNYMSSTRLGLSLKEQEAGGGIFTAHKTFRIVYKAGEEHFN
jgi:hypothetical protein